MPEEQEKCSFPMLEWLKHRGEAATAMNRIGVIHSEIGNISNHTTHLQKLDPICISLQRLEKKLVDAATGRKQIPLVSHLLMIVFLGTSLLIVIIEKSNRTIKIGTDGIEIGVPIEEKKP